MKTLDLKNVNDNLDKTLLNSLGIRLTHLEKGRVEATMPVDVRTHQPLGLLHGGASVALAETVASFGAWIYADEIGKIAVGQEINANHLRSVRSGTVKAIGLPIHTGKTSHVWEIKIYDEDEKLVSISRCTLALIELKN